MYNITGVLKKAKFQEAINHHLKLLHFEKLFKHKEKKIEKNS